MYAIIETGGKQYKVGKDDIIDIERLDGKSEEDISFSNVLLVVDGDRVHMGAPYIGGAKVIAARLRDLKGKKTVTFKYRRRKSSKTKKGHRQQLTKVRIKEIYIG